MKKGKVSDATNSPIRTSQSLVIDAHPNPSMAEFEKRAIMDFEQPIRDMDAVIRVDPD